uniref:Uncharacterized protein n=1 Tax=Ditylenchus dipsaci TaxID=166011 RepID=A0A915E5V0_9BILA
MLDRRQLQLHYKVSDNELSLYVRGQQSGEEQAISNIIKQQQQLQANSQGCSICSPTNSSGASTNFPGTPSNPAGLITYSRGTATNSPGSVTGSPAQMADFSIQLKVWTVIWFGRHKVQTEYGKEFRRRAMTLDARTIN